MWWVSISKCTLVGLFLLLRLDLRDEGDQQEFVNPGVRGRASSGVSGAYLTLDPLHLRDSGRYRCRVDFEVSPTLFAVVDLRVFGELSTIMFLLFMECSLTCVHLSSCVVLVVYRLVECPSAVLLFTCDDSSYVVTLLCDDCPLSS